MICLTPRLYIVTFDMKKFMLGCRFSFEAYAKNLRKKVTEWSVKTTEVLLNVDGHVFTKV